MNFVDTINSINFKDKGTPEQERQDKELLTELREVRRQKELFQKLIEKMSLKEKLDIMQGKSSFHNNRKKELDKQENDIIQKRVKLNF